ncbi:hypothetical protein, partial [Xanthovirga aplysinae]|uniref:hypothetical protein n=1 Tax=Xanthovirga aplysinae TaxID=2529853 RepID=UPI001CA3BC76
MIKTLNSYFFLPTRKIDEKNKNQSLTYERVFHPPYQEHFFDLKYLPIGPRNTPTEYVSTLFLKINCFFEKLN